MKAGQQTQYSVYKLALTGMPAQVHLYGNNVGGSAYNAVKSFVNGDSTPQWEITGPEASAEDVMTLHTGGSERVRIDSSGRVGIGTTPAVETHIQTSSGNPELRIQSTGANYVSMSLENSSRRYSTQIRTDQSNAYTVRDETGGGNRFLISTSGHITTPEQPSFVARVTASTTTAGAKWPTNGTPQHNTGNHWSTSTHRFTAPVAGRYLLLCSGYTNFTTSYGYMNLYINGTNQGSYSRHFNHNGSQQHDGLSMNVIWNLNANDYVEWGRGGGGGGYFDIVNVGAYLLG